MKLHLAAWVIDSLPSPCLILLAMRLNAFLAAELAGMSFAYVDGMGGGVNHSEDIIGLVGLVVRLLV